MATKKAFNITAVLYAAGGGVAAGVVTAALEKNITFLADKPKVTPLIIGSISAAGLYFAPEEYNPVFYGMIGAAGGDLAAQFLAARQTTEEEKSMAALFEEDPMLFLPEDPGTELIAQNIEMPAQTKELFISNNDDFFAMDSMEA